MSAPSILRFEWDPTKARTNLAKHGVAFTPASTVFRDPFALSIYDEPHSDEEERWVTVGVTQNGRCLVVIHTFRQVGPAEAVVRIVSARRATRREVGDYQRAPR
jgi:uncharacterized DUF497 family protein